MHLPLFVHEDSGDLTYSLFIHYFYPPPPTLPVLAPTLLCSYNFIKEPFHIAATEGSDAS